jgi:DNA-binding transcriptional ArsR family regulator
MECVKARTVDIVAAPILILKNRAKRLSFFYPIGGMEMKTSLLLAKDGRALRIIDCRPSFTRTTVPKQDPLKPQKCAQLLSALAAPERLKIVRFLSDGPHNVTEIAEMLDVAAVNVSHHLTVLKTAGLIMGKKKGRFVLYSLRPGVLEDAVEAGIPKDALNLGCCRIELPLGEGTRKSENNGSC